VFYATNEIYRLTAKLNGSSALTLPWLCCTLLAAMIPPVHANEVTMLNLLRFIPNNIQSAFRTLVSVRFHANMVPIVVVPLLLYLYLQRTTGVGAVPLQPVEAPQLIVFVFLAGALGGITNTYQRLKSMPLNEPERSVFNNLIAVTQVYATPMVAGTFAIVAYALFASGMLEGTLFPSFSGGSETYEDLNTVFNGMSPSTAADAAKAIIWGFIAGFSEKMIPNILDKMGEDAAEGKEGEGQSS